MSPPASGSGGHEAGRPRCGTFGIDSPAVPLTFGAAALALIAVATVATVAHGFPAGAAAWAFAAFFAACAVSYLYTTTRGKFVIWADLLDDARLRGDEHVADLGCGRGAVLLSVARRLTTGRVSGIDLWRVRDQTGNDIEATKRNARSCGVEDRVELTTGDITALPYGDAEFDLVVSSLVLNNMHARADRHKALTEALRVLEPGGKLIIADVAHTSDYARWLADAGMLAVTRRNLGVRGWWGGPWMPTVAVTASRPGRKPIGANQAGPVRPSA